MGLKKNKQKPRNEQIKQHKMNTFFSVNEYDSILKYVKMKKKMCMIFAFVFDDWVRSNERLDTRIKIYSFEMINWHTKRTETSLQWQNDCRYRSVFILSSQIDSIIFTLNLNKLEVLQEKKIYF